MGHVRTLQGKRGKTYQATWLDDQGRERVKTFAKMGEATDHLNLMEGAKVSGHYIDTSSRSRLPSTRDSGQLTGRTARLPPYASGH